MRVLFAVVVAAMSCSLSGCVAHAYAIETTVQPPLYVESATQQQPVADDTETESTTSSPYSVDPSAAAQVLVLTTTHLDRPSEVIGVVDASVPSGEMDRAMEELRARAATLHADAVLGVETHAPETGPIHLSGLAVRFVGPRRGY